MSSSLLHLINKSKVVVSLGISIMFFLVGGLLSSQLDYEVFSFILGGAAVSLYLISVFLSFFSGIFIVSKRKGFDAMFMASLRFLISAAYIVLSLFWIYNYPNQVLVRSLDVLWWAYEILVGHYIIFCSILEILKIYNEKNDS